MITNNIHFSGSSNHGRNIDCPLCRGLLWINTSWTGLPQYFFDETGTIDRYFICAWCSSILNISNDNLEIIERRNSLYRISSRDIVIIKENELSKLLFDMVKSSAHIVDNKIYSIGGTFHSKESFLTWCSNTVNKISQSNQLVRLPVIEI